MSLEFKKHLSFSEKKINEKQNIDSLNKILDECFSLKKKYPKNPKILILIGNILWMKLQLEDAIYYYKKSLEIDPDYFEGRSKLEAAKKEKLNLVTYLTYHNPKDISDNSIIRANQNLQKINYQIDLKKEISDDFVINLYKQMHNIIINEKIETDSEATQIHRESKQTEFKFYNCKRHFKVFNTFNVIPENCFGCYKILIQPRNVIEMLKLYLVFDKLKLKKNLTRKCMIELRPNIKGAYKGYIYCVGLEEAKKTLDTLNLILDNTIGNEIPRLIRRGCSEFSVSYPAFKEIEPNNVNFMIYNNDWKNKESIIDNKLSKEKNEIFTQGETLSGISLKDFLVIKNWLFYAKKIGDSSYSSFPNLSDDCKFLEQKLSKEFIKKLNFIN